MASRTIYGFELYTTPTNGVNEEYYPGKSSEVFTAGDIVSVSTTGMFVVTSTSIPAIGVVQKTVTMGSGNFGGATQVSVGVIPIDQSYVFLAGTNGDLGVSSIGNFYYLNIPATPTGKIQVDVAAGVVNDQNLTGQELVVVCLKNDPNAEGGATGLSGTGARQGLFRFAKTLFNP